MKLLSDFKGSGRAAITKSQSQIGQWTRSLLRRKPYSTPQFDVALPYEIWSVILWIVLDRIIDPLAYCDSDTYPKLRYRFDDAQGRHFQDWFKLRLVCRTWNSILGNCPHIVCSVDKSIPAEHRLARVTSMRCIPYGLCGERVTNLDRYPQLTSKLTMLAFSTYLHWSDQKFTHECITFNNVTCLYLGWLEVPAGRPDFWPSFSASFPRLIWLTVRGSLHLSGKISLPNLQILTMYPFALHEEVGYDLPSLRHLSISALSSPRRLLSTHGPSLHSLLLQYGGLF
ncbi:hypothetical protein CPB86DRAFT_485191 [Serendipita vermifera]|nr:hypothetical protein CPB86DRAFT_485191 [Serendipita vermifera]